MTRITKLESQVLQNIVENLLCVTNGAQLHDFKDASECWTNCVADNGPNNIKPSSLPGVMASLSKKGLAHSTKEGVDSVSYVTATGFEAYLLTGKGDHTT